MGREMGGRFQREGIYVYLWLIHVEVWQKTTKFCKTKGDFKIQKSFMINVDIDMRKNELKNMKLKWTLPFFIEVRGAWHVFFCFFLFFSKGTSRDVAISGAMNSCSLQMNYSKLILINWSSYVTITQLHSL